MDSFGAPVRRVPTRWSDGYYLGWFGRTPPAPVGRSPAAATGNGSVLVGQRRGDVERRQQGEDVRLQELHQNLERVDHERNDMGRVPAPAVTEVARVQDQVLAPGDE